MGRVETGWGGAKSEWGTISPHQHFTLFISAIPCFSSLFPHSFSLPMKLGWEPYLTLGLLLTTATVYASIICISLEGLTHAPLSVLKLPFELKSSDVIVTSEDNSSIAKQQRLLYRWVQCVLDGFVLKWNFASVEASTLSSLQEQDSYCTCLLFVLHLFPWMQTSMGLPGSWA